MDVTCRAITLIYLMICFLPFMCNSFISFLSSLPLHFFFFFLHFSFSYSPRHAVPIFFFLPILVPFLLLCILLAFSLYLPSDPPFRVIWLCLSSFSVVVQYLIDKRLRLSRYLLILKFSFSLFYFYSFYAWSSVCTVGEVASRSRLCFLSRLTEDRCRGLLRCMQ